MARSILLVGAVVWLLAGIGALVVAAAATGSLERLLPPLAIDTDALRGAVTAVGSALLAVGLTHVVVLAGLRAGARWASTGAILLAAFLGATMVGLGVAAATSAVAYRAMAPILIGAAVIAAVGAGGYALVAIRLVAQRRSGSAF